MSRIFVTGSSTGLGLMTGQLLAQRGHQVVLHARNQERAEETAVALPQAVGVVVGDLSTNVEMRAVAAQANALGPFDAVIHNAGVGFREQYRITEDGLPHVFAINVLAPYVLTALIERPRRLVYLSSAMHFVAEARFDDILWRHRAWNPAEAYSESKLYDVVLAFAVASLWRDVASNALTPGWVPTRMGGLGAPDDMGQACLTQAWLAVDEKAAKINGQYYYHMRPQTPNPQAMDVDNQARLIDICARFSEVEIPS